MGGLKPSGFSATQHTLIRRLPMPTTASTYNHLIALLPRNYERIHQQRRAPLRAGDEVISDLLSPNYWSLPLLLLPRNASATRVVVARTNEGREEHSHGVAPTGHSRTYFTSPVRAFHVGRAPAPPSFPVLGLCSCCPARAPAPTRAHPNSSPPGLLRLASSRRGRRGTCAERDHRPVSCALARPWPGRLWCGARACGVRVRRKAARSITRRTPAARPA